MPANSKLISPDIQNELLEASKQELLDIIRSEVQKATRYAILADEVKDASKRELVSLRYVLDERVKEGLIGLIESESLSAESHTQQLLKILELFDLPKDDCVGQAYAVQTSCPVKMEVSRPS